VCIERDGFFPCCRALVPGALALAATPPNRSHLCVRVWVTRGPRELRELSGDCCNHLSDATLSMVVARHGSLESLQLGSDSERVTSEALKVVAVCCPKLRRLCVSGIREVDRDSVAALFQHCKGLTEVGFLDSHNIDEGAFVAATSLRFLSIAGCSS
jgi:hypothetical protein